MNVVLNILCVVLLLLTVADAARIIVNRWKEHR